MSTLIRHLKLVKHIGEFRFKWWLDKNAYQVLSELGVRAGQTVLDFGCGTGTYTIPAAELVGDQGQVYALDVNRKALDKLMKKAQQKGLTNIVRIDSSGKEIELNDKTVDIILLIDVLQNIEDKTTLFKEICRVLAPGGTLAVYPMHITNETVEKLATSSNCLKPREEKYRNQILLFQKT